MARRVLGIGEPRLDSEIDTTGWLAVTMKPIRYVITALTMLKSGWVIVGSLPSQDGTSATKGDGCLLVLDPQGNVRRR